MVTNHAPAIDLAIVQREGEGLQDTTGTNLSLIAFALVPVYKSYDHQLDL
jgi:hypothetical protein